MCPMPPIKHFPPPAGIKAPPLSFATRVGDLVFISGIPGFDANGDLPDGFERSSPMSSPTSGACWMKRGRRSAISPRSTCC